MGGECAMLFEFAFYAVLAAVIGFWSAKWSYPTVYINVDPGNRARISQALSVVAAILAGGILIAFAAFWFAAEPVSKHPVLLRLLVIFGVHTMTWGGRRLWWSGCMHPCPRCVGREW